MTRTVLLVGRWAIKWPSTRRYGNGFKDVMWGLTRGVLANQSEAEWHRCGEEANENERRFAGNVAPVLHSWLGGLVNVYPRCRPLSERDAELLEASLHGGPGHDDAVKLGFVYPDIGPHPGDTKPENVGWLRDPTTEWAVYKLVWLDYDMSYNGCPHARSGRRNWR